MISADSITTCSPTHSGDGAAATVLTAELDDPGSYGRIVRDADGDSSGSSRPKKPGDATPEELAINEVNTGTYVFDAAPLAEALDGIGNDNAQGEFYLGDVLPLMRAGGRPGRSPTSPTTRGSARGQHARRPRARDRRRRGGRS